MPETSHLTIPITLKTQLPMAWRHQCGTLNDSPWPSAERESFCTGCRCEVARMSEIEARYLLVSP